MQASNAPSKIQTPFANAGDKQVIPVASQIGVTDGRASYTDGFPPLTRTPIVAGGVPPFGTDMNGILNAVTAIQQWQSAGGRFVYDAAFAAAIGGYPKGATLQKADGSGTWLCTADNNTANPDTGGANWQDFSAGRLIGVQVFTANGVYTPTAGTKSVVVEAVGGGGSGGACPATATNQAAAGGGGGAGSYGKARFTTGFSGVTVTIGQGGSAPAAGLNNGSPGSATSFGALLSCPGGTAGNAGAVLSASGASGVNGGNATGPSGANVIGFGGEAGANGVTISSAQALAGKGGSSSFGSGGHYPTSGGARSGTGYGSGSSGVNSSQNSAATAGLAGQPGIVIVYEYA